MKDDRRTVLCAFHPSPFNLHFNTSFAHFFAAPANFFAVRLYKVEHEKLGELPIFLVPVAVDEKGYHYEAVFN